MSRVIGIWRPRSLHFEMALRQSLGSGSGLSSFLSKLSIAGMVIAVAFLLASLSVMNGFEREMRLRILNLVPHVTIRSYLPESAGKTLPIELGDLSIVKRSYRFSERNALFSAAFDSRVGRLIYARSDALEPLQQHLTPRLEKFAPGEIVLGKNFAEALGVEVGQPLVALISEGDSHRRFLPETVRLAAVLDSGTEIDSVFALAPMTPSAGGGINSESSWALTIADPLEAPVLVRTLRKRLGPQFWVTDWTQTLGNLYQAIQLSRQIVGLMLAALLVVAVFNIVTSLVLVMSDRRPSSAMLRAMGASPSDILTIFTVQGTIIGAGGAFLGAVLGGLLAFAIPGLVSLIETFSGQPLLDTSVYPLAYVPVDLRWSDFLSVSGAALLLSLFACALPAIGSARASISDSLREIR